MSRWVIADSRTGEPVTAIAYETRYQAVRAILGIWNAVANGHRPDLADLTPHLVPRRAGKTAE